MRISKPHAPLLLIFAILIYENSLAQQSFQLSIFHRRDASTIMEWVVKDRDTLHYMPYYPAGSDYFRFLVYRFRLSANDRWSAQITSLSETDTLDHTTWKWFDPRQSHVLQERILGVKRQVIRIEKNDQYFASFVLLFRRKE